MRDGHLLARVTAWLERHAISVFALVAATSSLLILWLGLGLTFFFDEWAFIESRSLGDPSTWFAPHNEHWSTLPIIVYRGLVETVGLRSYVPYLTVLLALHVVASRICWKSSDGPGSPARVGYAICSSVCGTARAATRTAIA